MRATPLQSIVRVPGVKPLIDVRSSQAPALVFSLMRRSDGAHCGDMDGHGRASGTHTVGRMGLCSREVCVMRTHRCPSNACPL